MSAAVPIVASVPTARDDSTCAIPEVLGAQFVSLWLVVATAMLGGAVAINEGRLHWQGLQWLALAITALAGGLILCRSRVATVVTRGMVDRALLLVVAAQMVHLAVGGVVNGPSNLPKFCLWGCLLAMNTGLMVAVLSRRGFLGSSLMVGAFAVSGWAAIWTDPVKRIDVLEFQSKSAAALAAGQNPYHARYRNVYHPSTEFYGPGVAVEGWLTYSYPYPPTSLLLVVPGFLAGDIRYAHLSAMSGAAALLILAGRGSVTAVLAAAVLLTSPRSLFVVQNGWTEPLLILLAAFAVFCSLRWRLGLWIALGLLLSVKQYLVLALPLLPLLRGSMRSTFAWFATMILAFMFAAATVAPFYYADPPAFLRGVLEWQLVQPFRHDALSFSAMRAQLTGKTSTGGAGFFAAALAMGVAVWKAPRNAGGFMAAAALVFCCFFALNKQAFCNYYLFVIGLCCCAVVGLAVQDQSPSQGRLHARKRA